MLPFDYAAESPADMLAEGIVDEITDALAQVREFHVIARQSAFALRDQRPDIPTAAELLRHDPGLTVAYMRKTLPATAFATQDYFGRFIALGVPER